MKVAIYLIYLNISLTLKLPEMIKVVLQSLCIELPVVHLEIVSQCSSFLLTELVLVRLESPGEIWEHLHLPDEGHQ